MPCERPVSVGISERTSSGPRRSTRAVSMSALMTKALPVWRWQSRQWQQ
jgi:hypothetical protein